MPISRRVCAGSVAYLLASVTAGAAIGQTSNTAPPQTLPGLDDFSLPSSQPTPTPTPIPVPTPVPGLTPTPSATPTPRDTPTPAVRPTPRAAPISRAPLAVPVVVATPASTPIATPTGEPLASASPSPTRPGAVPGAVPESDGGWRLWGIAALLLAVAAGAGLWWRRHARPEETMAPAPVVMTLPIDREPAAPAIERAHLSVALLPRRAGLNLLSATVEAELLVRNDGTAPAVAIRVGAVLLGATAGSPGDIAAVFAQPVGRLVTPAFALAPGEERRVRLVVALPRADIEPLDAAGRPIFVPVVAVNLLYDAGGVEGQTARAFAVGVERSDSVKLAPFWLDQPPRMYDLLGARPYAATLVR